MTKGSGWLVSFLALSFLVSACGGGGGALTKGGFCSDLVGAYCSRAVACQLVTAANKADCVSDGKKECCEDDNSCGEKAEKDEEAELKEGLSECTSALAKFECTQLAMGELPVACDGGEEEALTVAPLQSRPDPVLTGAAGDDAARARHLGRAAGAGSKRHRWVP